MHNIKSYNINRGGKMKIIKKGNVYRKAGWFKENEKEIYTLGCIIVGFLCFVVTMLIRG